MGVIHGYTCIDPLATYMYMRMHALCQLKRAQVKMAHLFSNPLLTWFLLLRGVYIGHVVL